MALRKPKSYEAKRDYDARDLELVNLLTKLKEQPVRLS